MGNTKGAQTFRLFPELVRSPAKTYSHTRVCLYRQPFELTTLTRACPSCRSELDSKLDSMARRTATGLV